MEVTVRNTVRYLTLMELPDDVLITPQMVHAQYRRMCFVYHPDNAIERYRDGEKFLELKLAEEYLIENIDAVNRQIRSGFEPPKPEDVVYGRPSWEYGSEEEEERRRAEAERRERRRTENERQQRGQEARKSDRPDWEYTGETSRKNSGASSLRAADYAIFAVTSLIAVILMASVLKRASYLQTNLMLIEVTVFLLAAAVLVWSTVKAIVCLARHSSGKRAEKRRSGRSLSDFLYGIVQSFRVKRQKRAHKARGSGENGCGKEPDENEIREDLKDYRIIAFSSLAAVFISALLCLLSRLYYWGNGAAEFFACMLIFSLIVLSVSLMYCVNGGRLPERGKSSGRAGAEEEGGDGYSDRSLRRYSLLCIAASGLFTLGLILLKYSLYSDFFLTALRLVVFVGSGLCFFVGILGTLVYLFKAKKKSYALYSLLSLMISGAAILLLIMIF